MHSSKIIALVKGYWDTHYLYNRELADANPDELFVKIDAIKRNDAERFSISYWEFDRYRDKKVLDIGCGPGWYTVNYALQGAYTYACDLTHTAAMLTLQHLRYNKASAHICEGNAEALPFRDNVFDLVLASGVLHHTPDTLKACKEAYRVLKTGGKAKITLYRKSLLHQGWMFFCTRKAIKLLCREGIMKSLLMAKNGDDFIRCYDGIENPVGVGKSKKAWAEVLREAGFFIYKAEVHYFPKRFFPYLERIPDFFHRFLDGAFGTLIYFELEKLKREKTL